MPDILVRGLDRKALLQLKARARRHGRSLQAEAKMLLERAAASRSEQIAGALERWDKQFATRRFSDSARLIREDRRR
jgi:plasmid stability protein